MIQLTTEQIDLMRTYAMMFVGLNYKWGGQHPAEGYDCSGLVQELLAAVGVAPPTDTTAQGIFDFLKAKARVITPPAPAEGDVVLFGKSTTQITHVAFMVSPTEMVEAGGGGSAVVDESSAIAKRAFVRIRPVRNRKDLVATVRLR